MHDNRIPLEKLTAYGSKEAVVLHLKAAGCGRDTIECCIACLDYLVYQIDRCQFEN